MIAILNRLNLKVRLYLFVGTSIVLIGGITFLGLVDLYSVKDASKDVYSEGYVEIKLLHKVEVMIDKARLVELKLYAGDAPKAYERNIRLLNNAIDAVDKDIAFMADATNGYDTEVMPLVLRLRGWWNEYRREINNKLEVAMKNGRHIYGSSTDPVSHQHLFYEIMHTIELLLEHEELEATAALEKIELNIMSSIQKMVITATLVFMLFSFTIFYIFKEVSKRLSQIKRLKDGLESVKSGDFNVKIVVEGGGDLSVLTEEFNLMTRQLHEDKINQEQSAMVLGWYADESSKKAAKLVKLNDTLTKMQAELVSKNKRLNESIDEIKNINQQLQETERQMIQSEKMASIGQLSAGVAHEINNPIGFVNSNLSTFNSYIIDFINLIQMNKSVYEAIRQGDLDKAMVELEDVEGFIESSDIKFAINDVSQLIDESMDGIERVISIIKGLKDFAHVGSSDLVECDINKSLKSTIKLCWHEIKYKATVETDFGEISNVKCQKQKINQVFINIIINAAQAISKQGVIRVVTYAEKEDVVIKISDNGSGIPKNVVDNIFDPFFTTKPVGKGTGLGLSIVYGIVQEHGGCMGVDTEEGRGTTFTVKLSVDRYNGLGRESEVRKAG